MPTIGDHYPSLDPDSCMSYGMGHGCDSDCPALWEGNCEEYAVVIPDIANELHGDELAELIAIYLSPNERLEFICNLLDDSIKETKPKQEEPGLISIW